MSATRTGKPARKAPRGQRDLSLPHQEWRFEVGEPDHGARLDLFLKARLAWRSRQRLREAATAGHVEIRPHKDPQRAEVGRLRGGTRLRRGQEVVVRLPVPRPKQPDRREYEKIPVLWEDDLLLAVNKPAQMNVYPTPRHRHGSLMELVHQRHRDLHGPSEYSPSLCHRLDRETSGLVLFAKSRAARAELARQFEERNVEKTYLAVVRGAVEPAAGTIDLPIGPAGESTVEIKMGAARDGQGQPAVTRYRVLRHLTGRSLVELAPRTGRQHQLRVHMAAIGHPLVGDKLYLGGDRIFLRSLEGELDDEEIARLGLARQALHAWRLGLRHPESRQRTTVEAPLWPDMESLL